MSLLLQFMILNFHTDGKPADLGAQFIHGRKGNPVFDIAAKLKRIPFKSSINIVEESLTNSSTVFYTSSGQKVGAIHHLLNQGILKHQNISKNKF